MFDIQQRDVPEQLVLTEQRNVKAGDLPDWIRGAMGRLGKTAANYGGVTGPLFVVYHGRMSEDTEVLAEVCAPIAAKNLDSDAPTRREPAHRELYTRLKKSQVVFPEIQSAFMAVGKQVQSQGLRQTADPREVYFTDFFAAKPSDEVVDVAFPIQ